MGDRFLALARSGNHNWQHYLAAVAGLWLFVGLGQLLTQMTQTWLSSISPSTPLLAQLGGYIAQNLPFLFLLLGLFLVILTIHHRSIRSLVTAAATIHYRRMAQGLGLWGLLLCLSTLVSSGLALESYQLTADPVRWLIFLPLVLLLTPMQTTTEELLLRGYLLQALSLLTRNRRLLIGLSGLVFALAHLGNPEVSASDDFLWAILYYFLAGCFPALLTLWDNSLELAIGCHAAQNLFVVLFVQPQSSVLDTPAIWTSSGGVHFQQGFFFLLVQVLLFCQIVFSAQRKAG